MLNAIFRTWGSRTETRLTLDDPSGQLFSLPKQREMMPDTGSTDLSKPTSAVRSPGSVILSRLGRSKSSSGYGSVSGSEEDDKFSSVSAESSSPSAVGRPMMMRL